MFRHPFPSFPCLILALSAAANPLASIGQEIALDSVEGLRLLNVSAEESMHNGRASLHVTDAGLEAAGEDKLVILDAVRFQDGVIEIDIAGSPGSPCWSSSPRFRRNRLSRRCRRIDVRDLLSSPHERSGR